MVRRIILVYADWCPHCNPPALEAVKRMEEELKAPVSYLNIDDPQLEREADRIVQRAGDWCEDYLIPQIFLEHDDGRLQHIFTGFSEGPNITEARLKDLLSSSWYRSLKEGASKAET